MAVRLYANGAAPAADGGAWVISYAERMGTTGQRIRQIVQSRHYATYEEAEAELEWLGPGLHRIVGFDPMQSCVPLPRLERFRLIHDASAQPGAFPFVRIFEILGR